MLSKFLAAMIAIVIVSTLVAVFLKDPAPAEKAPMPKLELPAIEKSVTKQLPVKIDEVIVTASVKQ